ncbi:MAG: aminotransferase class IV [Xanthomonadaceae bacterium]|jgi:branched-chain amino acid aminotransferase|nr:aminotransferase class IV [Xanthomonadaceae bacterium]
MSLMQFCDGEIAAAEAFSVPLTSHALHYGTGVFEGIRSYATDDGGAAVFRLPEHLERMKKGAEALGMKFDVTQATGAVLATLRANGHRDAYIRPLLWFNAGGLGLDVDKLSERLMVATLPWTSHLGTHRVRLTVSPFRRNPAKALPPLKLCGNYVNSILAKREATQRGFGEALFVDDDGFVVECTGENVFLVKDGRVTAVAHGDALPGITRDTVIQLTGAESRPVRIEELKAADEVFLTGTSAEIARVEAIDERLFAASPFGDALAARYADIVRGRAETARGWLTRV